MVKIKDFTFATKIGGQVLPPPSSYTPAAHEFVSNSLLLIQLSLILNLTGLEPLSLPVRALECPICFKVVKNAVSCVGSGCHYTICEVHAAELKACPQCKSMPFKTVVEFALRHIMENLSFLVSSAKDPSTMATSTCTRQTVPNALVTAAPSGANFRIVTSVMPF